MEDWKNMTEDDFEEVEIVTIGELGDVEQIDVVAEDVVAGLVSGQTFTLTGTTPFVFARLSDVVVTELDRVVSVDPEEFADENGIVDEVHIEGNQIAVRVA